MKNKEKKQQEKPRLPLLDSYDNEGFMMMLEEIGAIKGEQCISILTQTPTESK